MSKPDLARTFRVVNAGAASDGREEALDMNEFIECLFRLCKHPRLDSVTAGTSGEERLAMLLEKMANSTVRNSGYLTLTATDRVVIPPSNVDMQLDTLKTNWFIRLLSSSSASMASRSVSIFRHRFVQCHRRQWHSQQQRAVVRRSGSTGQYASV